jgi:hypothetical protein
VRVQPLPDGWCCCSAGPLRLTRAKVRRQPHGPHRVPFLVQRLVCIRSAGREAQWPKQAKVGQDDNIHVVEADESAP